MASLRSALKPPVLLMCAVVVLGVLLEFIAPKNFADAFRGIGEALIIAGLLGLTVDSYLKRSLVREIGSLALRTLFGVNAPQEYIDLLSDSLRDVAVVSLSTEYRVRLEEAAPDLLKVTSEVRIELVNISTQPWTPIDPHLAASKAGSTPSRFTEYEITTRQPQIGLRAVSADTQRFSNDENPDFLAAQLRTKDGATTLVRKRLRNWRKAAIAPGGSASIQLKGETYQPRLGGIPFVTRNPTLRSTLHVSGSELARLEIVPYIGSQILNPAASADPQGSPGDPLDYTFNFVHAQSTLRVEWAPIAKKQAPSREPER